MTLSQTQISLNRMNTNADFLKLEMERMLEIVPTLENEPYKKERNVLTLILKQIIVDYKLDFEKLILLQQRQISPKPPETVPTDSYVERMERVVRRFFNEHPEDIEFPAQNLRFV